MGTPIPQDWPGHDVNVEVWSSRTYEIEGRRTTTMYSARVVHRATGASARATGPSSRHMLAVALYAARRRARAYETLGLGDLAAQVKEWWREAA